MKSILSCWILCLYLLPAWPAFAKSSSYYGLSAISEVYADGKKDTTKDLQLAVGITEKLGQGGEPLSFHSWLQLEDEQRTGKVTHQVRIYRGEELMWNQKRVVRIEPLDFTADSWNSFCNAYSEGLLPGDMVIFDFKLRGFTLGDVRGSQLSIAVAPPLMSGLGMFPWDNNLWECE